MPFSTSKWHQGEKWERFFQIYDRIAKEQFGKDSMRIIPTSYGDTQVFLNGNPSHPPMVLVHGFGACSLMYGEWLVPTLSQQHYTIALDTIGDMGRSYPRDGDPKNGPQNEREMADWAMQVLDYVLGDDGKSRKATVVGYSLGSYIAACVAEHYPDRVDKLILMAPAGVFAPLKVSWIIRALGVGILSALVPSHTNTFRMWFVEYMLANPSKNKANLKHLDLLHAAGDLGASQVGIVPKAIPLQKLHQINQRSPTLLMIGREETATDPSIAVQTAKKAGICVKQFPVAGHLLDFEVPKDDVLRAVHEFLSQ